MQFSPGQESIVFSCDGQCPCCYEQVTFQAERFPYGPTMEGQYIIKNLLIISAALVVGGTVRREEARGA